MNIREHYHSTVSGSDEELQLHVKQHIPNDGQPKDRARRGITLIAAHCSGYFKEVYEPLWEDLLRRLSGSGVTVNSIWMADIANQGTSGVLNEQKLGNEYNWFDHSRDLLLMVNHFRKQITRPIIGVGHSMGGSQIVSKIATFRRDVWPSHSAAEASTRKNRLYKTWDPRVIDNYIKYGFRQAPTSANPDIDNSQVTTITSKHQEAFALARPNYDEVGVNGNLAEEGRVTHPDLWQDDTSKAPFYKPEMRATYQMLETLRPPCLYVNGTRSPYTADPATEGKIKLIGTGVGGNGGVAAGRVRVREVNGGHFFPFESCDETAGVVAEWIVEEVRRSDAEERIMEERWEGKEGSERQVMDRRWVENMKGFEGRTAKVKL